MKRNYGIDLLRIISILMAVVAHVMGQGGMLDNFELFGTNYWIAWTVENLCFCSLNCFALISGYLSYKSGTKLSRALSLWIQILFYTVGALVAVAVLRPQWISARVIAEAIFPITQKHYWYMSAYFGLLVFQPLLNLAIEKAEQKVLATTLLVAFVMFSILPRLMVADPYNVEGGYTAIWLMVLYPLGAYIHKYNVADKVKKSTMWWVFLACWVISVVFQAVMQMFPQDIFPTRLFQSVLLYHNSPTMVLMSVALLIALTKQEYGSLATKVISWFAPAALGVYLIHVNKLVWVYLFDGFAAAFAQYHWALMIVALFGTSLGIYVGCTLIEKARIWLFKLLKVDAFCKKADQWAEKLLNKFIPV